MLKLIVMRVHGQVMVLFSTAYIRLTTCLLRIAKHLLAHTIQIYRSVQTLLLRLVQIQWNFKVWAVNQTIAAQSIKQGLSTAKAKVIQIGSQLLTTVLQTLQYASLNQLQNKGFVVKMKLAQLRLKGSSYALIRIVRQWIQVGLKLLGIASQHRLVAYLLQQLEKVRVALTNLVQSCTRKIVAALTHMANRLKAIGLKLQDSVHLLLQRVLRLQSLSKKRAEKTKLVRSLLKKAVAVLTRMVHLMKVIGLKQVGTVRQPPQRAQRRRSKGH